MNSKTVAIAKAEATRFLKKVREYEENPPRYECSASQQGGALRRASMDLTRALADLRRVG